MKPELALRDIHLPEPTGWWPTAPGWWIVAALILLAVFYAVYWFRKRTRERALQRTASRELLEITQRHAQNQNDQLLCKELSTLLRRVAISIAPREAAAGLTGEAWLDFLNTLAARPVFDKHTGAQLLTAPYQASHEIEAQALLDLCQQWLTLATQKPRGSHA